MNKAVMIGGTFNPITRAHEEMGKLVKAKFPDCDIYYVPSNLGYIKDWKEINQLFDDTTRLSLVESVVSQNGCSCLDKEAKGELSGKTFETVEYLKNELGYKKVIICFGSDKLGEIERWYKAKELVEENEFIVLSRGEYALNSFVEDYKTHFHFLPFAYADISSTRIREAYDAHNLGSVKEEIPGVVYDYLINKQAQELI